MRKPSIVLPCLLVILPSALVAGQGDKIRAKYTCIEMTSFDVREGVQFPPAYRISLLEDLVEQLENTNRFEDVLRPGEQPSPADVPTVKLTGTITEFEAGSRAKRYLIGFGAGATKLIAQVQFVDRASGGLLLDCMVNSKVTTGGVGGESIGVTQGLAKEVAKVINRRLFAGVPSPRVKTYSIKLYENCLLGTSTLEPGEYRFRLAGSRVVVRNVAGKNIARAKVRLEKSGTKFTGTTISGTKTNGRRRIEEIRLGASDTKLVFE